MNDLGSQISGEYQNFRQFINGTVRDRPDKRSLDTSILPGLCYATETWQEDRIISSSMQSTHRALKYVFWAQTCAKNNSLATEFKLKGQVSLNGLHHLYMRKTHSRLWLRNVLCLTECALLEMERNRRDMLLSAAFGPLESFYCEWHAFRSPTKAADKDLRTIAVLLCSHAMIYTALLFCKQFHGEKHTRNASIREEVDLSHRECPKMVVGRNEEKG